ncbi:hypothetical protein C0991_001501, partial [Blastosporella zonata]
MSRSTSSSTSNPHPQVREDDTRKESDSIENPEIIATDVPERHKWWWKYRQLLREPMAEFTGVMLLIIFGNGVDCQVVLSSNPGVAPSAKG